MAGSYRPIGTDIWREDSIRALTIDAQRAYLLVYTQADLNRCGVLPFRVSRLAKLSADDTPKKLRKALSQLEDSRHLVIDEAAEELFVRTYVRHDGLLAQPQVVTAMVQDFPTIDSDLIRTAFLSELRRIWDLPDLPDNQRRGLRMAFGDCEDPKYARKIGTGLNPAFQAACAAGSVTPFPAGFPAACPAPSEQAHAGARAAPPAPTPAPTPVAVATPSAEGAPRGGGTSTTLLEQHQTEYGPLPTTTRDQLEQHATKALLDGTDPQHVLAGLAEWRQRPGAKPGLLPHLIGDAQHTTPHGPSPEVEAWLEAERAKRKTAGAR